MQVPSNFVTNGVTELRNAFNIQILNHKPREEVKEVQTCQQQCYHMHVPVCCHPMPIAQPYVIMGQPAKKVKKERKRIKEVEMEVDEDIQINRGRRQFTKWTPPEYHIPSEFRTLDNLIQQVRLVEQPKVQHQSEFHIDIPEKEKKQKQPDQEVINMLQQIRDKPHPPQVKQDNSQLLAEISALNRRIDELSKQKRGKKIVKVPEIVEVIKEVPFQVIKEVVKQVDVIKEVPKEITVIQKEYVDKPVVVEKEVIREIPVYVSPPRVRVWVDSSRMQNLYMDKQYYVDDYYY